jgi:hypothetical protein
MSEKICVHLDCHPGLTMDGLTWELLPNHGVPVWKVTQQIGTIFGSKVEGQIEGRGLTQEIALERLMAERDRLNESLWI